MKNKINFNNVKLFSDIDSHSSNLLKAIFTIQTHRKGEFLINYGEEVPGVFILAQGEVTVLGQYGKTPLAVLGREAIFGEMSFLEAGHTASASIVVSSETAEVLFCQKDEFIKHLQKYPNLNNSFYKGAAILIADRLRRASKIITEGYQFVVSVLDESEVDSKLGKTRSILNETGNNIVSRLFEVLPLLDEVIEESAHDVKKISEIKNIIESVVFAEGQNFDRLGQQLDHVLQHFGNLKIIINGGSPQEVMGDTTLFNEEPQTDFLFF
ncbi:cyclic nucleotide-binding domain-containing protein [Desulfobacterales bacterium HSG17]|nr:cyclic nucleotide-binding domain-containing protein [Desulfobacterales bacterium HSG17]